MPKRRMSQIRDIVDVKTGQLYRKGNGETELFLLEAVLKDPAKAWRTNDFMEYAAKKGFNAGNKRNVLKRLAELCDKRAGLLKYDPIKQTRVLPKNWNSFEYLERLDQIYYDKNLWNLINGKFDRDVIELFAVGKAGGDNDLVETLGNYKFLFIRACLFLKIGVTNRIERPSDKHTIDYFQLAKEMLIELKQEGKKTTKVKADALLEFIKTFEGEENYNKSTKSIIGKYSVNTNLSTGETRPAHLSVKGGKFE